MRNLFVIWKQILVRKFMVNLPEIAERYSDIRTVK